MELHEKGIEYVGCDVVWGDTLPILAVMCAFAQNHQFVAQATFIHPQHKSAFAITIAVVVSSVESSTAERVNVIQ